MYKKLYQAFKDQDIEEEMNCQHLRYDLESMGPSYPRKIPRKSQSQVSQFTVQIIYILMYNLV